MQAKQQELHNVPVTMREAIVFGLMHLREHPERALVLRFKRENSEHFTPAFRIKFMQTAGGMQFGFSDIIANGVTSGRYLPPNDTAALLTTAIEKIRHVIESQERFADRFDREDQRVVDLELILVDEIVQPVDQTNPNDFDDLFPDAGTVELKLPSDVKTGQGVLPLSN